MLVEGWLGNVCHDEKRKRKLGGKRMFIYPWVPAGGGWEKLLGPVHTQVVNGSPDYGGLLMR